MLVTCLPYLSKILHCSSLFLSIFKEISSGFDLADFSIFNSIYFCNEVNISRNQCVAF